VNTRTRIEAVKAATKQPFAVNYLLSYPVETMQIALDAGGPIVQFSWGYRATTWLRRSADRAPGLASRWETGKVRLAPSISARITSSASLPGAADVIDRIWQECLKA